MIKTKINLILIFIICSFCLIIYSVNNENIRCSSFGYKFLDDILGLDVGHKRCLDAKKYLQWIEGQRYHEITNKKQVKCPINSDVMVIIGQSNSANTVLTKEYSESKNLNYFKKKCYLLSDPVLGATDSMNSIVPSLSSKLKNKKPIIFITNGWGGTSVSHWSPLESPLTKYVRNNIADLIENNNLKYIIWIQGEADSGSGIDYVNHFKQFRTNLFRNLKDKNLESVKFIITQTSICNTDRDEILNAQQKSLKKLKNTIITDVTDNLDGKYRYDGCHFNSRGAEKITDEISSIINVDFIE